MTHEEKEFDPFYDDSKDYIRGWNESISAAVKVAMEYDPTYGVGESISSKIEALRKG